jgi:hypothetical protein
MAKDFGRRRRTKSSHAGTRGPHEVGYGDLDIWLPQGLLGLCSSQACLTILGWL